MLLVKALLFTLFSQILAMPQPTPEPLSSRAAEKRDLHDFYNTVTIDVVSFYEDFINNRYAYLNSYKSFFLTHTFSLGSASNEFSSIITYTDDSFATAISNSPALSTALATIATEFPWYSSWVEKNVASATASSTANSAERNLPILVSQSSMHLAIIAMTAFSAVLCLAVF